MTTVRRYGAARLKRTILEMIDRRVTACRQAEERYVAMAEEPGGGLLGSVELAKRSAATERSARFEAELIRRCVAELPASGEAVNNAEPTE